MLAALRKQKLKKKKGNPNPPLWFFLYLFLIAEASSLKAVLKEPPRLIPIDSAILRLNVGDISTVSSLVDCSSEDKGCGQLRGYPLQDESPAEKMSAKFPPCKVSSSGFFSYLGRRVPNTPQPGVMWGAKIASEAGRCVCLARLSCLSFWKCPPVAEVSLFYLGPNCYQAEANVTFADNSLYLPLDLANWCKYRWGYPDFYYVAGGLRNKFFSLSQHINKYKNLIRWTIL